MPLSCYRIIDENIRMPVERKNSTDGFGSKKGRHFQEACVAWLKARDDRNETENISTGRVEGMVHVRDVDVSASSEVIIKL